MRIMVLELKVLISYDSFELVHSVTYRVPVELLISCQATRIS